MSTKVKFFKFPLKNLHSKQLSSKKSFQKIAVLLHIMWSEIVYVWARMNHM